MTGDHEAVEAALAFAATLGLQDCAAKSVEQNGADSLVLVEGTLAPKSLPAEHQDRNAAAAFLSEPFCVRMLVSCGAVVKHEWLGIQLS